MPKKSRRHSSKPQLSFRRTGVVALFSLAFVSMAAAYQSPIGQTFVRKLAVLSAHPGPSAYTERDKDDDDERLRPEEESHNGDDSLKFKKREYDFRAYPNKTIPQGSREKAWEQFQAHYRPGEKKSTWKPVNQGEIR